MKFSVSNWKIAEPFLQAYRKGDRTALLALADKIEEDLDNPNLANRIRHLARYHNYAFGCGSGYRNSYDRGNGNGYSYSYGACSCGAGYSYGYRSGYGYGYGCAGYGYGYGCGAGYCYGYGYKYGTSFGLS